MYMYLATLKRLQHTTVYLQTFECFLQFVYLYKKCVFVVVLIELIICIWFTYLPKRKRGKNKIVFILLLNIHILTDFLPFDVP